MIPRSSMVSFDSLLSPEGNTLLGSQDDTTEYLDDNSSGLFQQMIETSGTAGNSIETELPKPLTQTKQKRPRKPLLSAEEKKAKRKLNDEKYRQKKKAKIERLEEECKKLQQLREEVKKLRQYSADKDDISRRLEEQIKIAEKLTAESDQLKEEMKRLESCKGQCSTEDLQRPACYVSNPGNELSDNELKGYQQASGSPLAGHEGNNTLLCYFDSQLNEFIKKLDEDVKSNVKFSDFVGLEGERETVGAYSFPVSLILSHETITNGFGDVTAGCLLNHDLVENAYILFCAAVHEMNQLSLDQVTESTIFKWRDTMKDAMRINCNVCFAMEYLKKVARGFFGLKALEDLWSVDNQILKMERQLYSLWNQQRNIDQQLSVLKNEKANKEELIHVKSEQCEDCIAFAEDFRGKTLGSGLFQS